MALSSLGNLAFINLEIRKGKWIRHTIGNQGFILRWEGMLFYCSYPLLLSLEYQTCLLLCERLPPHFVIFSCNTILFEIANWFFHFINRFSKSATPLIKMGIPSNFLWLLTSVSVLMLKIRKIKIRYLSVDAYLHVFTMVKWDLWWTWLYVLDMLAVAKSQVYGRSGISKIFGQCAVQN